MTDIVNVLLVNATVHANYVCLMKLDVVVRVSYAGVCRRMHNETLTRRGQSNLG